MAYDLLIKNGRICDGSGAPAFLGDVAVRGDTIVATGRIRDGAKRVIDAQGLVVAPGFIDPHTHYDAQITWDPLATCSCWHGVTTVVFGNCGFGIAPCRPQHRESLMRMLVHVEGMSFAALSRGISWQWETLPQYLDFLHQKGTGINVATLIGHSAVRHYVMGEESSERRATAGEIEAMAHIVREAMQAGAFGFATSTSPTHFGDRGKPVPSRLASEEEILALAGVLQEVGRGIIEIAPGPKTGYRFLSALARAGNCPVTWAGLFDQGDYRRVLEKTADLRKEGTVILPQVSCRPLVLSFDLRDPFPYEAFRSWKPAVGRPVPERKAFYGSPEFRAAFREDIARANSRRRTPVPIARWELVTIKRAQRAEHRSFVGKSVAEVAQILGKDPLDTFLDLSIAENLEMEFVAEVMNTDPQAVGELISHPTTLLGLSDGGAHVTLLCDAGYATYLLGTWVRERQVLSLEEGVRRLTSAPAEAYGIPRRGRIQVGFAADLTLFDPDTVSALSPELVYDLPGGEARLVQRAEGVHYIIVSGEVLLAEGKYQGNLPGKVLRSFEARL